MTTLPANKTVLFTDYYGGYPQDGNAQIDGSYVASVPLYGWDFTPASFVISGYYFDRLVASADRTIAWFWNSSSGMICGAGFALSDGFKLYNPWYDDIHNTLYYIAWRASTGESYLFSCTPNPGGATDITCLVAGVFDFCPLTYGDGFMWFVLGGSDPSGKQLFAYERYSGRINQLSNSGALSGFPNYYGAKTIPARHPGASSPPAEDFTIVFVCGHQALDFLNPSTWSNYNNDIGYAGLSLGVGTPYLYNIQRCNVRPAGGVVTRPSFWTSWPMANGTAPASSQYVMVGGTITLCSSGFTFDYGVPAGAPGTNPCYQGRWGVSFDGTLNNGVWGPPVSNFYLHYNAPAQPEVN